MKPVTKEQRRAEGQRIAIEMLDAGALVDVVEHEANDQPDHFVRAGMMDVVDDERLDQRDRA